MRYRTSVEGVAAVGLSLAVIICSPPGIAIAGDDFSSVAGKVCRGYYNQTEGGTGSLTRPESAFKTTTVDQDGKFTLYAAKARPGVSRGWDTASGNDYLSQGGSEFKAQPDGSLMFRNSAGNSYYTLTRVKAEPGSPPDSVSFKVLYKFEAGTAVGKAVCTAK